MSREVIQMHQPPAELHALEIGGHHCIPQQGSLPPLLEQAFWHVYTPVFDGGKTPIHHSVKDGVIYKAPHINATASQEAEGIEFLSWYQVLEKVDTLN